MEAQSKVKVLRPQFSPPVLPIFSDLSEDARIVMKALLADGERKKQFIINRMQQKPNESRSYYSCIYRGSFNADIPQASPKSPSGMTQNNPSMAPATQVSPSLFSESSTQLDPDHLDTISHRPLVLASEAEIKTCVKSSTEQDIQHSQISDDFSLSPPDMATRATPLVEEESELVLSHGKDGKQNEMLEEHTFLGVEESTSVCADSENNSLFPSTELKVLPLDKSCEDISKNPRKASVITELSPPDCDLDEAGQPRDRSCRQMNLQSIRDVKRAHIYEEEIPSCSKDKGKTPVSVSLPLDSPLEKVQKLSSSSSVQDNDLEMIEYMLSENTDLSQNKRKFKTPFKLPASTKAAPLIAEKKQAGASSGGIPPESKDQFCFNDQKKLKALHMVNAEHLCSTERVNVGKCVLQSEEVLVTVVFKDGSTLFTSNSSEDSRRKAAKRKTVGLTIGYRGSLVRKEDQAVISDTQDLACIYIPTTGLKNKAELYEWACPFIQDMMCSKVRKVTFQAKDILHVLLDTFVCDNRVVFSWIFLDVKVAAWLLDPDNPVQTFEDLIKITPGNKEYAKDRGKDLLHQLKFDFEHLGSTMLQLFHKLKARGLWPLFINLETRLIPLLTKMERSQMKVDSGLFLKYSDALKSKMSKLEKTAFDLAGHSFCINSHPQLRQVIFEELRLDVISKSKKKVNTTSVNQVKSTSEAVLTQLIDTHPLPAVVLEYRQLQKLKSTYVDGLMGCVDNGYLQTHWDQTAAATGRLTSYQPNLQSVPKQSVTIKDYKTSYIIGKEDLCYEIFARDPIVAEEGMSLLAADFQQIELRLLAHLSDDPQLINVFVQPKTQDIFIELTSQWLGKPGSDVTQAEREQTKRVVYSVMYGAGKEKLAEYLKIDPSHAKAIITSFLEKFPAINIFTKRCTDFCQNHGYTCTIFNRRRLIPNINSKSPKLKAQAERQAVNFCVQGSAADICKAAMLQVEQALVSNTQISAKLLLQIHDELLYQVSDDSIDEFSELLKTVMESAELLCGDMVQLKVPLNVSLSVGKQWGHMENIIPVNKVNAEIKLLDVAM